MMKSVAIVTGASSGIGRATALRLAQDFSAVVLVARNKDDLNAVAASIQPLGAEPLVLDLDLGAPEAAGAVVEATLERFGQSDALLNIADAVPGIDVFEMTDEQWNAGLALKFHAARRLTLHAWRALRASSGAVVFTSGTAAVIPKASGAAVGTINAAIEALAKSFAERGITEGVQVNSVSPGAIMTTRRLAMLERAATTQQVSVDDAKRRFLQQAGIQRFGEPGEVADLMAYLVSPTARWMTGTVVRMDGGEVKSV